MNQRKPAPAACSRMRQAAVSPLLDWLICSLFSAILFLQTLIDRYAPPQPPQPPPPTRALPRPRPQASPPRRVVRSQF
jgi:hypothetical protein